MDWLGLLRWMLMKGFRSVAALWVSCWERLSAHPVVGHSLLDFNGLTPLASLCKQVPRWGLLGRVDLPREWGCGTPLCMGGSLLEESKYHGASERPGKTLRTKSARTNTSSGTEWSQMLHCSKLLARQSKSISSLISITFRVRCPTNIILINPINTG